jgi:hypothetical protein
VNSFFWTSGHLGWGIFALVAFTLLWALAFDLAWRLTRMKFVRLLGGMCAAWVIVAILIVLGFGMTSNGRDCARSICGASSDQAAPFISGQLADHGNPERGMTAKFG